MSRLWADVYRYFIRQTVVKVTIQMSLLSEARGILGPGWNQKYRVS